MRDDTTAELLAIARASIHSPEVAELRELARREIRELNDILRAALREEKRP